MRDAHDRRGGDAPVPVSWAPSPQRLPACGDSHSGPGQLDESARRLDHGELAVAARLVAEGHAVTTVPERGQRGSRPDFVVCGQPLEVKCLLTMAERSDGRRATSATVHNRLMSAVEQAGTVIVSTEGSGCRPADAAAGLRSFAATGRTGSVGAVRVIGDGFDLSWVAPPRRAVGADRGTEVTRPPAGARRPTTVEGARPATGSRTHAPTGPVPARPRPELRQKADRVQRGPELG